MAKSLASQVSPLDSVIEPELTLIQTLVRSDEVPSSLPKSVYLKNFAEAYRYAIEVGGLTPEKLEIISKLVINSTFLNEQNRLMATVTEKQVKALSKKLRAREIHDSVVGLVQYIKTFPSAKQKQILRDVFFIKYLILIERFSEEDKTMQVQLTEYFIYSLPISYHPE